MERLKNIMMVFLACLLVLPTVKSGFDDSFNSRDGDDRYNPAYDYNEDGIIDGFDLAIHVSGADKTVQKPGEWDYRADRVLVKYRPECGQTGLVHELAGIGVEKPSLINMFVPEYVQVSVPPNKTVEQFLREIQQLPSVETAQFDYLCYMSWVPNDPYYSYQWNFGHVGAENAWLLTNGGKSDVVVAVLDTGIAYEDYGNYSIAPDLVGTAFTHPYNFIADTSHANDDEGHGTHVAGTIAQATNNGIGVAGLAYRCTLMPVKVLGSNGVGSSGSLSQGIRWAADKGARIINMSLGFPIGSDGGKIVRDAIAYAYYKGVILVAASGNDAGEPWYTGGVSYPAAFGECIAVGATRYDKKYTYYSNYGWELTCVAPGGDVRYDQNRDGYPDGILQQTFAKGNPKNFGYYFYQGTSMATPHVSAAAALFVSREGGGPDEFLQAIKDTSFDLGPKGFDKNYGYGLINIPAIVKMGRGWGAN
ncbi:MAG: S8 family peptidase [bacterium]